ncbi:MAG: hypothetical protein NWF05_00415 [Candidatus Bathyarchaeota archaeon]|nr:hypothetical protein [Candidatus Bathyarchaeota archaeon]
MTNAETENLGGKTLSVYAYAVKEGKPVGPREVMRGANLSSPSVAYWHLQKLEANGLLEKNTYGEYVVKEKVGISGHLWVGRNLVPRMMCYSLFFMGVLATEIVIIANQLLVQGKLPSTDIIYLAITNGTATFLFLAEGFWLRQRNKPEQQKLHDKQN